MDPSQSELIKDPDVRKFIMDSIKWVDFNPGYGFFDKIEDKIDTGSAQYVGRGYLNGDVYLGKYLASALFAYFDVDRESWRSGDQEKAQVATGDPRHLHWVPQSGIFKLSNFPARQGIPVPAGEMRGKLVYIGRARIQQKSKLDHILTLPYPVFEGKELRTDDNAFRRYPEGSTEYEVLAYIGPPPSMPKPPFMDVGDVLKQGGGFGI